MSTSAAVKNYDIHQIFICQRSILSLDDCWTSISCVPLFIYLNRNSFYYDISIRLIYNMGVFSLTFIISSQSGHFQISRTTHLLDMASNSEIYISYSTVIQCLYSWEQRFWNIYSISLIISIILVIYLSQRWTSTVQSTLGIIGISWTISGLIYPTCNNVRGFQTSLLEKVYNSDSAVGYVATLRVVKHYRRGGDVSIPCLNLYNF